MNNSTHSQSPFKSEEHPLTIRSLIQKGRDITQKTFRSVFFLSFIMIGILYTLQFQTSPVISDLSDVVALLIVGFSIWVLSVLHATIVTQMMCRVTQDTVLNTKQALRKGIQKSWFVFLLCILYMASIGFFWMLSIETRQFGEITLYAGFFPYIALMVFVIPILLISVTFCLSLFIVVLRGQKQKDSSVFRKMVDNISESFYLLRKSWWKMLGLMLLNMLAIGIIWGVYQLLLKFLVIFSILFFVAGTAAQTTFWYGCVLALILELKAKRFLKKTDHKASLQPEMLKKSGI